MPFGRIPQLRQDPLREILLLRAFLPEKTRPSGLREKDKEIVEEHQAEVLRAALVQPFHGGVERLFPPLVRDPGIVFVVFVVHFLRIPYHAFHAAAFGGLQVPFVAIRRAAQSRHMEHRLHVAAFGGLADQPGPGFRLLMAADLQQRIRIALRRGFGGPRVPFLPDPFLDPVRQVARGCLFRRVAPFLIAPDEAALRFHVPLQGGFAEPFRRQRFGLHDAAVVPGDGADDRVRLHRILAAEPVLRLRIARFGLLQQGFQVVGPERLLREAFADEAGLFRIGDVEQRDIFQRLQRFFPGGRVLVRVRLNDVPFGPFRELPQGFRVVVVETLFRARQQDAGDDSGDQQDADRRDAQCEQQDFAFLLHIGFLIPVLSCRKSLKITGMDRKTRFFPLWIPTGIRRENRIRGSWRCPGRTISATRNSTCFSGDIRTGVILRKTPSVPRLSAST